MMQGRFLFGFALAISAPIGCGSDGASSSASPTGQGGDIGASGSGVAGKENAAMTGRSGSSNAAGSAAMSDPDAMVAMPATEAGATTEAGNVKPPGKIPIFVAQGDMGRTMVSCDDGNTWVGNRSWDLEGDPLVCGSKQAKRCTDMNCSYSVNGQCKTEPCCYDTPDISKGVIYGAGAFVATWGWGQPGSVRRSTNGIDWTTTHPDDSFGGVAFGSGKFVVASRTPFFSGDGSTWTASKGADFRNADGSTMWSVRRFAYADYQGEGRFVAVASGNTDRDMLVSSDGGQTWWRPTTIPSACAIDVSTYGGIVSGNDVIVIVDQHANACRSTDGGKTWSLTATGLTQVLSHGVWTGKEFRFWGDDAYMVTSADGATWSKTKMATPMRLGPVAMGGSGTLVGTGSVWDGYEKQHFFRSTDGLTWKSLATTAFVQGHNVLYLAFGYADPSTTCPAQ
jgi:hypothetical protein